MASAAIGALSSIAGGLLAAHSARLHDAQAENSALPQAVNAYDADLAQIADAYNGGTASDSETLNALASVDAQVYQYLHSLVGKPGTAWVNTTKCDKSCTAACCIYNMDLAPGIRAFAATVQKGGGDVAIPKVFGSKYGGITREGYTIRLVKPNPATSLLGALEGEIQKLTGNATTLPGSSGRSFSSSSVMLALIIAFFFAVAFIFGRR